MLNLKSHISHLMTIVDFTSKSDEKNGILLLLFLFALHNLLIFFQLMFVIIILVIMVEPAFQVNMDMFVNVCIRIVAIIVGVYPSIAFLFLFCPNWKMWLLTKNEWIVNSLYLIFFAFRCWPLLTKSLFK